MIFFFVSFVAPCLVDGILLVLFHIFYNKSIDLYDALMEGVLSSVGMPNPLEIVFTNEDLD